MIQTVFFYRELFSENFLQTENPRNIIPVRPKNEFNPENLYYSDEKKNGSVLQKIQMIKTFFQKKTLEVRLLNL